MVRLLSLLNTIERTPVSISFLKNIVDNDVRVIHYQELSKFNRDKLFSGKKAVIVLIPHRKIKKGHFICLLPKKKGIEYFSSLGMP